MATLSIKPGYREFISKNTGLTFVFVLSLLAMPLLKANGVQGLTIGVSAAALLLVVILMCRYIILTSIVWIISKDTICRIKGVFCRRTDHLELYRVIDYGEYQSWLQKLLKVKTITIISTDRTDSIMNIHGVPASLSLVSIIRKRVEKCKQEKRIYEITNP